MLQVMIILHRDGGRIYREWRVRGKSQNICFSIWKTFGLATHKVRQGNDGQACFITGNKCCDVSLLEVWRMGGSRRWWENGQNRLKSKGNDELEVVSLKRDVDSIKIGIGKCCITLWAALVLHILIFGAPDDEQTTLFKAGVIGNHW